MEASSLWGLHSQAGTGVFEEEEQSPLLGESSPNGTSCFRSKQEYSNALYWTIQHISQRVILDIYRLWQHIMLFLQ